MHFPRVEKLGEDSEFVWTSSYVLMAKIFVEKDVQ